MTEQEEKVAFLESAGKQGIPAKDILPQKLHRLPGTYISAVFEIVYHDFTRGGTEHSMQTLQQFFYLGWQAILGL